MESDSIINRAPRFKTGQQVRVVGPSEYRGLQGVVTKVTEGRLDFVHRYKIAFSDGTSKTFFGFELELVLSESA